MARNYRLGIYRVTFLHPPHAPRAPSLQYDQIPWKSGFLFPVVLVCLLASFLPSSFRSSLLAWLFQWEEKKPKQKGLRAASKGKALLHHQRDPNRKSSCLMPCLVLPLYPPTFLPFDLNNCFKRWRRLPRPSRCRRNDAPVIRMLIGPLTAEKGEV